MTEALNRAPTGDSARGPGVDETPGPHPLTRRRPDSSTSAHATSQASWLRFPRFSTSAHRRRVGLALDAMGVGLALDASAPAIRCDGPTSPRGSTSLGPRRPVGDAIALITIDRSR